MPIYKVQAPNGKTYDVEGPENADENMLFGVVQQQIEEETLRRRQKDYGPGFLQTFGQSVARGAGELASTFTDIIPAAVGSALGFEDYAREQFKEAEEKKAAREAKYPTLFRSYKEIEGLGDFAKYATETVGEQLANLGTSLIPGVGLGSFVGRRAATAAATRIGEEVAKKGLVGEAATQFELQRLKELAPELAKSQARGQAAGIYLGSYAQNAPEVFQSIYENNDGQLAPGAAALFGAVAAALDAVLPSTLAKQLTAPVKIGIVEKVLEKSGMEKGLLRSVTAGTLRGVGTEGLTEGAQEAISIAAERFVSQNPKVFGSKEWDRIVESAIKGAIAGGAFGGVGGGVEGARAREEVKDEKGTFETAQKKLKGALEKEGVVPEELGAVTPTAEAAPEAAPITEAAPVVDTGISEAQARIATQRDQALAAIEADKQRIADLTAKTQVEREAAQAAPTPTAAPATLETIQKIDDPVAFGKLLGIGRTARILRPDGPLAGLDLSKPEDAARVKTVLETYASGKPAAGATAKIEALLKRPEFQGVPTDVTRPYAEAGGEGAGAIGARDRGAAARAVEPAKPSGVEPPPVDVEQPAGRKVEEPRALETQAAPAPTAVQPEAAPAQPQAPAAPTEVQAAEQLASTETEEVIPSVGELVGRVDNEVNTVLGSRAAEAYAEAGLDPASVANEDYKNTEAHNMLRIPRLVAEYSGLKNNFGTPNEAVSRRRMAEIRDVLNQISPDAQNFLDKFETMPESRQGAILSSLNQNVFSDFDSSIKAKIAETKAAETKKAAPEKKRAQAVLKPKTVTPSVKITEEEAGALLDEYAQKYQERTGKKLFLPKYEGPVFNDAQRKLAESGDVNGLLRNLLDSIQDPAIKQVLRRIRSLNLKTKIKIAPIGQSGIYNNPLNETDPDTIFLDPEQGMNAHTFIHEVLHAAISNVLANPNHPLTKQFTKFFISVQDRLGAAYGATDLQEFAAELTSNPSFQAVLKTIKAPKSENMFVRILQSIAEFLGFAPKTTAFEKGLNFINDAIDITNDVPATAAQRLFLGDGTNQSQAVQDVAEAQPSLVGKKIEETKNLLSNLSGSQIQRLAFGLLRLDNLHELYKKELPSIGTLLSALERRVGKEERDIGRASENFKKFMKVQKQYPNEMRRLNDLAIKISEAEVNVLAKEFSYRSVDPDVWEGMTQRQRDNYLMAKAQNKRDYTALKEQFDTLPEPVKEVYKTVREEFDAAFKRYRAILEEAAKGSPALLTQLREQFTINQPLVGYIPFKRYGDFWLEFIDPDTDMPVATSFESIRERQKFIDEQLKNIPEDPRRPRYVAYNKFEDIQFDSSNLPPTHFMNSVVQKLRSEGASDAQINAVYQAYLAAFPAESVAKQFMKRTGKKGMEADIIRGYNDLMVRWARKLANSEFLPQIDQALEQIKQEGKAHQRASGGDPAVGAAVQNILDQRAFFHNPTYGTLVSGTTQLSFFEFMAGNISSALVNLTSLPLMVYPLLTGKFGGDLGWSSVGLAITNAMNEAKNNWGETAKYKKLYETLDDHGQLKHTMAREVLEGRRQKSEDYTGIKARIMDGLAYPFSVSERWNRATTAIAAFNLATKQGMNEQDAINYALETVKTAHTSGMAVTGPRWMQTPLGRVFFTFKSILWQQAYVLARAFHQAFKGEDKAIRDAARRQLLATYGMATIFTGVKGMPFYGAISVMAEMLASLFGDDDEPFDFNEFMRSVFPEFLYKGAFNYATNLEVANRAGLATDLVFRDDPRGVAEHGYVLSAMQQMFGPVGSIAVNSGRAVQMFKDGHYERSLETVMPSFFRNGMKGIRYLNEGAVTLKGDPIDEDISAYNSVMQVVGFAPADLSNKYEMLQMAKGFERAVELRRRDALRLYDIARRSGDSDLMDEVRERIQSFNEKHPKYRITQESLRRSQKAREAAEKEMIYGVRFNKSLRGEVLERFFED